MCSNITIYQRFATLDGGGGGGHIRELYNRPEIFRADKDILEFQNIAPP